MDKKALNLLRKYYVNWNNERKAPTEKEWEYGVSQGVFFESEEITHDEMYDEVKQLADIISPEDAAKGFLYSLSSGDLRYRTAISSLLWARSLPEHCQNSYKPIGYRFINKCNVCGMNCETENIDWNIYNAFRMFPGAGYHSDLGCIEYALFDLREFYKLNPAEPNDEDYYILNRIFGTIKKAAPANKANAVIKMIKQENILNATSNEIHALLGVLSMCSILETEDAPGYLHSFVNAADRDFLYEKEFYYPLNFWRGKNGVNYDAVEEIFGSFSGYRLSEEASVAYDKKAEIAAENYFSKQKKIWQIAALRMENIF